jgi:hypothetical protein
MSDLPRPTGRGAVLHGICGELCRPAAQRFRTLPSDRRVTIRLACRRRAVSRKRTNIIANVVIPSDRATTRRHP